MVVWKDWKSEASKKKYLINLILVRALSNQLFLLFSNFVLFNPAHKADAGAQGRGLDIKCAWCWMGLQYIVHTMWWMVLRHRRWQSNSELGTALAHCPFLMLKIKLQKDTKSKRQKSFHLWSGNWTIVLNWDQIVDLDRSRPIHKIARRPFDASGKLIDTEYQYQCATQCPRRGENSN